MVKTLLYNGIKWILVSDDGLSQLYRHPTDPHRRLSTIDPTYTFQPATADTYMASAGPNNNYGSGALLTVDCLTGSLMHSLLKFDLTAQIPAGAIINSATLSLYYYLYFTGDPKGRTYWAYRVTQTAWTEYGATWNKYDGTNDWTAPGGDYTTTDGASVVMPSSYGWVVWTVTAQVQTAIDSVGRIAHFLLRDDTEGGAQKQARFYSDQYVTDTTKRPKLYVDWFVPADEYIDVSDSGAGSESASIDLSVADSGVGTESDLSISPLGTDAGVGVEAVTTSAKMTVTDAGAGAESPTVEASIPSMESGVGADAPNIENQLTETDNGIGSESPGISASIPVAETGAGVDALEGIATSIPVTDSAVGVDAVSPSSSLTVADSGLGLENVTTPGTLTVTDEGKGAEFAWRIKPTSPMIDALVLPHVLSIRISDPATMSDKKVQGGSLPRRKMVGKPGRVVEVDGWSDRQTEINALEAPRDGVRRTFYHPSGDSFGVLVTGFEPSRTVDQYNRRLYRLAVAEAN